MHREIVQIKWRCLPAAGCSSSGLWMPGRLMESTWNTGHSDARRCSHRKKTNVYQCSSSVHKVLSEACCGLPLKTKDVKKPDLRFLLFLVHDMSPCFPQKLVPVNPQSQRQITMWHHPPSPGFIVYHTSCFSKRRWSPVLLWHHWTHPVWELTPLAHPAQTDACLMFDPQDAGFVVRKSPLAS